MQNALLVVASDFAIDAFEAMVSALAQSGPTKKYLEPFPMRSAPLNAGFCLYKWKVGAE